jgi:hypothetical protein
VLAALAVCLVATTSLTLAAGSPAAAFGAETFGCRIAPGTVLTFTQSCMNRKPASTYSVAFLVENTSGTYTYAWSITGPYLYIIGGCDSASPGCTLAVPGGQTDSTVTVSVTYTQGAQSATKYSIAFIAAFCGNILC